MSNRQALRDKLRTEAASLPDCHTCSDGSCSSCFEELLIRERERIYGDKNTLLIAVDMLEEQLRVRTEELAVANAKVSALERDMKAWMKTADDVQRDRNQIAAERDAALSKLAEVKRENERLRKQWDPCDPCYTRTLEREVERLRAALREIEAIKGFEYRHPDRPGEGHKVAFTFQARDIARCALATPPADDKKENG